MVLLYFWEMSCYANSQAVGNIVKISYVNGASEYVSLVCEYAILFHKYVLSTFYLGRENDLCCETCQASWRRPVFLSQNYRLTSPYNNLIF